MGDAMVPKKIVLPTVFFAWIAVLSFSARAEASGEALKIAYDPLVRSISARYAVDPQLVHSIIAAESDYNRFAISAKGALGLMQLMPETVKDYGVKDVFDPAANIEGGVKHLKNLTKVYGGRTDLVLAAYNAGRTAVDRYDGIPPFQETQLYIQKVKALYIRVAAPKKGRIIEFRDASGRLIVTNDVRLAARCSTYK
jgi:soluble lytic murein transglycosylase-like protein